MGVIEKAVDWAIKIANDQSHGYSQSSRWGPDYDCSSFVIEAYEQAGVPVREAGASYTGNMRPAFISCGFVDVTYEIGLNTGYGIQAGDVLLNYSAHTCLAIGGGRVANCRTDEGNPQTGDQSGNEIRLQSYWDGSPNRWNCVLRYKNGGGTTIPTDKPSGESSSTKPKDPEPAVDHNLNLPMIRQGSKGTAVSFAQTALNLRKFDVGAVDGDFGPKTRAMVISFQDWAGIAKDGVVGPDTWKKLLEVKT